LFERHYRNRKLSTRQLNDNSINVCPPRPKYSSPRKLARERSFAFGLAMQLLGGGQIVPLSSSCNTSPSHPASTPSAPLISSQPDTPKPSYLPWWAATSSLPSASSGQHSLPTQSKLGISPSDSSRSGLPSYELLARCFKDVPEQENGVRDIASELIWLRGTYEFLFLLLSAGTYLHVCFVTPIPLSRGSFADTWDGVFLKSDETFVFLGSPGWILLCFRDLNTGGGRGRMRVE
jgi:hypothetical protein